MAHTLNIPTCDIFIRKSCDGHGRTHGGLPVPDLYEIALVEKAQLGPDGKLLSGRCLWLERNVRCSLGTPMARAILAAEELGLDWLNVYESAGKGYAWKFRTSSAPRCSVFADAQPWTGEAWTVCREERAA